MKSVIIILSLLLVTCKSHQNFSTNYYDLPSQFVGMFDNTLKSNNSKLSEESFEVIKEYVLQYLLASSNPVSRGINSNYFWYVYNALPEFVADNERHQGYYADQNDQPFEQKLIAYAIYRVDRSPENIQNVFNFIKPNLTKLVSEDKYDELGIRNQVDGLIFCYQEIIKTSDYKKLLSDAYIYSDTVTGMTYNDGDEVYFEKFNAAYGFTGYDLAEIISNFLKIDRYTSFYGSPLLSFWMRRNHEGNMETVYEILKEIQLIYK